MKVSNITFIIIGTMLAAAGVISAYPFPADPALEQSAIAGVSQPPARLSSDKQGLGHGSRQARFLFGGLGQGLRFGGGYPFSGGFGYPYYGRFGGGFGGNYDGYGGGFGYPYGGWRRFGMFG